MNNPIYVTQPYLPPLEEFVPYLEKIWDNKILTNGGPFHKQLEKELCDYLGVKHISLFTNGTIALVTALQALRITGGRCRDAVACCLPASFLRVRFLCRVKRLHLDLRRHGFAPPHPGMCCGSAQG